MAHTPTRTAPCTLSLHHNRGLSFCLDQPQHSVPIVWFFFCAYINLDSVLSLSSCIAVNRSRLLLCFFAHCSTLSFTPCKKPPVYLQQMALASADDVDICSLSRSLSLLHSLSRNIIGDSGAAAIGGALKHNKTLEELSCVWHTFLTLDTLFPFPLLPLVALYLFSPFLIPFLYNLALCVLDRPLS